MPLADLPFRFAHHMALVPTVWLGVLHFKGRAGDRAWWLLSGVFLVSWTADLASLWVGQPFVSMVYPVAQAIIVAFVFWDRTEALWLIIATGFVGIADLFWHGIDGPDILLRTVAWLSVCGVIYPLKQLDRLRTSLLVYFGLGWACWMFYAAWPGWTSWSLYQLTRAIGIGLFCVAATSPIPKLKLTRR